MGIETELVDYNETYKLDPLAVWNSFQTALGFSAYPSFVDTYGIRPYMSLTAGSMHVKSLGLPLPFSYHSAFKMQCGVMMVDGEPQLQPIPKLNVSAEQACIDAGGCAAPTQFACNMVKEFTNPWTNDTYKVDLED